MVRGMNLRSCSFNSVMNLSPLTRNFCKDDTSLYVSEVAREDRATCKSIWNLRNKA